jgi:hypothetical protein
LVANVALNALSPRVTCVASAAGATAGTLTLAGAAGPDAHAAVAGETGLPVPVMPLDALLQAQRVTLLKVDVEGMELPVLEGATALLADDALGAVIVELNGSGWRYGRSDDAVVARLTAAGFCAAAYDPFTRTLTPLPGANPHRGNTIFVRSFHDAAERVRRGPPVTVQGWVL